jgi:hypothetical protein
MESNEPRETDHGSIIAFEECCISWTLSQEYCCLIYPAEKKEVIDKESIRQDGFDTSAVFFFHGSPGDPLQRDLISLFKIIKKPRDRVEFFL